MLGKTLIIANPTSQHGNGHAAALRVEKILRADSAACESLDLVFTRRSNHAYDLALNAGGYDTLICVGGDGTVSEAGNGLMKLPREDRPTLAVVPVGSGNDYAKTLGMSSKIDKAVAQIMSHTTVSADVGVCNDRYFLETLSFGLDASIALDTQERRKRTGASGLRLYAASCVDQLLHNKKDYLYSLSIDGTAEEQGECVLLALQIGQTYGSGFKIAPDAKINDGLLDLCIAKSPISIPRGAYLFARAKNGKHVKLPEMDIRKLRSAELSFAGSQPSAQLDGEGYQAESYSISVEENALNVIVSPERGVV